MILTNKNSDLPHGIVAFFSHAVLTLITGLLYRKSASLGNAERLGVFRESTIKVRKFRNIILLGEFTEIIALKAIYLCLVFVS